ncbi:hypothetical protein EHI8A_035520 [Entamoeba histolytica HM-1:IMSS-B]|nr:hypothetical protein EHI8A_035520 [Entamoeba histolytica HM-1:IMSS-B]
MNNKYSVLLAAARAAEERNKKEKEDQKKRINQIESFSSPMKKKSTNFIGEEQVKLLGDKIGELQLEKSKYLEDIETLEKSVMLKEQELQIWKSETINTYLKNVFGKSIGKKGVKEVIEQVQNVLQDVVTQNIHLQQEVDQLHSEIIQLKQKQ